MPFEEEATAVPSRLVLVVEDEALIALDLEARLQGHGWRVLGPAATVAQALWLLEDGEMPALALLDVNLRGELVTPVAERLRVLKVPFVLASAYDPARLTALGLGGTQTVSKPVREKALLAALERAMQV